MTRENAQAAKAVLLTAAILVTLYALYVLDPLAAWR